MRRRRFQHQDRTWAVSLQFCCVFISISAWVLSGLMPCAIKSELAYFHFSAHRFQPLAVISQTVYDSVIFKEVHRITQE